MVQDSAHPLHNDDQTINSKTHPEQLRESDPGAKALVQAARGPPGGGPARLSPTVLSSERDQAWAATSAQYHSCAIARNTSSCARPRLLGVAPRRSFQPVRLVLRGLHVVPHRPSGRIGPDIHDCAQLAKGAVLSLQHGLNTQSREYALQAIAPDNQIAQTLVPTSQSNEG